MGTADKLLYLQDTKVAIKNAIEAKGVTVPVGTTFRDYSTKIGDITSGGPTIEPYVRNPDWLTIPDNINGVQKISILYAVENSDTNPVSFYFAGGAYTVDWGDGTVTNYSANSIASYNYNYTGNLLGSLTYEQRIITITPQAGQNLVGIRLGHNSHPLITLSSAYPVVSGILDININAPFATSISIGSYLNSGTNKSFTMSRLERCSIGQVSSSLLDLAYLFQHCYNLREVLFGFNTTQITNWNYSFQYCKRLTYIPITSFSSSVTTFISTFQFCESLQKVDITINSINFNNSFYGCVSLKEASLTITSNTNIAMSAIFSGCTDLSNILIVFSGTGRVTDASSAFIGCPITNLPITDFSVATKLDQMMGNTKITTLAPIDLRNSSVSILGMFASCSTLVVAPVITNSANVTNVTSLFSGCTALVSTPNYSFPLCTSLATMFNLCGSLMVIGAITTGTLTGNASIVSNCYSLSKMTLPLKFSFSVAYAKMSAAALNAMYTALPTVTGQTVTVTGNYGTVTDTPSIATAKGWTVTG